MQVVDVEPKEWYMLSVGLPVLIGLGLIWASIVLGVTAADFPSVAGACSFLFGGCGALWMAWQGKRTPWRITINQTGILFQGLFGARELLHNQILELVQSEHVDSESGQIVMDVITVVHRGGTVVFGGDEAVTAFVSAVLAHAPATSVRRLGALPRA